MYVTIFLLVLSGGVPIPSEHDTLAEGEEYGRAFEAGLGWTWECEPGYVWRPLPGQGNMFEEAAKRQPAPSWYRW